jgi:adenosine specific kinase
MVGITFNPPVNRQPMSLRDVQIILGQSHFIKTIEDVSECLVNCVPNIKFGIAFCEASGPCLVRHAGNDTDLDILATDYASYYYTRPLLSSFSDFGLYYTKLSK